MTLRRRDFLLGTLGFCIGGALAAATGLSYYYIRRARRAAVSPNGEISAEEWVLTKADYREMEARNVLSNQQMRAEAQNVAGKIKWQNENGM